MRLATMEMCYVNIDKLVFITIEETVLYVLKIFFLLHGILAHISYDVKILGELCYVLLATRGEVLQCAFIQEKLCPVCAVGCAGRHRVGNPGKVG